MKNVSLVAAGALILMAAAANAQDFYQGNKFDDPQPDSQDGYYRDDEPRMYGQDPAYGQDQGYGQDQYPQDQYSQDQYDQGQSPQPVTPGYQDDGYPSQDYPAQDYQSQDDQSQDYQSQNYQTQDGQFQDSQSQDYPAEDYPAGEDSGDGFQGSGGAQAPETVTQDQLAPGEAVGDDSTASGDEDPCTAKVTETENAIADRLQSGELGEDQTNRIYELLDQADGQCADGDMGAVDATLGQARAAAQ